MIQLRMWLVAILASTAVATGACDDSDAEKDDTAEQCRIICEKLDECGYMELVYYADITVDECVGDFTAQITSAKESMPECAAFNDNQLKCVSNLSSCEDVANYWGGAAGTGEPYPCRAADVNLNNCTLNAMTAR